MSKFNQLINRFINEQPDWHRRTSNYYQVRLTRLAKFMAERGLTEPDQVDAEALNCFFGSLRRAGYAWSTRNGAYTAARAFFIWLTRRKIIANNPFADPNSGLKRPRKVRTAIKLISQTHIKAIINAARAQKSLFACRDLAIMLLLATTGMRREEIVTLTINDIDMAEMKINITGKGGHQRGGYLSDETRQAIEDWLQRRPVSKYNTVFVSLHPSKQGKFHSLNPNAINDILTRWRNHAGLPPISVSPHKWRHAFATQVAAKAKNPFALQILLGHTDIKTTSIYVHPDDDELRRAAGVYKL